MTEGRRFGWGMVGTGNAVRTLMLPALAADPRSEVVGFVSGDPSRAEKAAGANGADWWPDLGSMLEDPRVDVVYVASRHDEHARQVEAACAAGRPVLCEKPLATSAEDATAAVDAARRAGVVLAICHPLRGFPAVEGMRQEVRRGAVGAVMAARAAYSLPIDFPAGDWHVAGLPPASSSTSASTPSTPCGTCSERTSAAPPRPPGRRPAGTRRPRSPSPSSSRAARSPRRSTASRCR